MKRSMTQSSVYFVLLMLGSLLAACSSVSTPAVPTRPPATLTRVQPSPPVLPAPIAISSNCPSLDAWVVKSETGEPETFFCKADALIPVVSSPAECGEATAKLIAHNGAVTNETKLRVGKGKTFFGDYNPNKTIAAGSYRMEFWQDKVLFKSIALTIT